MNDIIKIVESLEKSGVLSDGASETVKHEIKKQEGRILPAMIASMVAPLIAPMTSSLKQTVDSSLINVIIGKGQEI